MITYTVHEFEIKRQFFYTGNVERIKAGSRRAAVKEVAKKYGGTVMDGNSIRVPTTGLGYDVFEEKG